MRWLWVIVVVVVICGLALLAYAADVPPPPATDASGWLIQGGGIGAALVLLHRWVESVRADMRAFRAEVSAELRSLASAVRRDTR